MGVSTKKSGSETSNKAPTYLNGWALYYKEKCAELRAEGKKKVAAEARAKWKKLNESEKQGYKTRVENKDY